MLDSNADPDISFGKGRYASVYVRCREMCVVSVVNL